MSNRKGLIPTPVWYNYFKTPAGQVLVATTTQGLSRLALNCTEAAFVARLEVRYSGPIHKDRQAVAHLVKELEEYFQGERSAFACTLDMREGTAFQRRVWNKLVEIPYGEVRSYGWLAQAVDCPGGARAVGSAVGANPIGVVVPCHRVIRSDGSLGGYGGGGVTVKRYLLNLEGTRLPAVGK